MSGPKITVARKSGAAALAKRVAGLTRLAAYVGIPASDSRKADLLAMSGKTTSKKKKSKLAKAANQDINNAELLFVLSKGSPAHGIPPRPVLEPAVEADGNRQAIASELAQSAKASLEGDKDQALSRMRRAGLAGQSVSRSWFTDPRNHWAPNAPATIAAKGSSRPMIDTGAMRAAITNVIKEE